MHKIKKLYSSLLVISPILFIYGVGIATVSLADLLLVILFPFLALRSTSQMQRLITHKQKVAVLGVYFLPFLLYCFVSVFIGMNDSSSFLRTVRYCFYLINVMFFVNSNNFDYKYGLCIYKFVAITATIYLLIQLYLLIFRDVYLPGIILSAKLLNQNLYEKGLLLSLNMGKRCTSFFGEPAHYATYVLGYLSISLFRSSKNKAKNIILNVFLSIGILLSTSLTGIILMVIMWITWCIVSVRRKLRTVFLLITSFVVLFYLLRNTYAVSYFIREMNSGAQATGRFSGYSYLLKQKSILNIIFGRGMVSIPDRQYFAGYASIYYYFGLVGLILFCSALVMVYTRTSSRSSKGLLLCLALLSTGTEVIMGIYILVFVPFILTGSHDNTRDEIIEHFSDYSRSSRKKRDSWLPQSQCLQRF